MASSVSYRRSAAVSRGGFVPNLFGWASRLRVRRHSILQIWSSALADIMGARREWAVAMISSVSMPLETDRGSGEVRVPAGAG